MNKIDYQIISLDGSWLVEGMNVNEGLLPRKAYEPDDIPKDPIPAEVPGIVQNHLFQTGRIEDPYWEMNNEKILWIEENMLVNGRPDDILVLVGFIALEEIRAQGADETFLLIFAEKGEFIGFLGLDLKRRFLLAAVKLVLLNDIIKRGRHLYE
jgi:hypothetical protein